MKGEKAHFTEQTGMEHECWIENNRKTTVAWKSRAGKSVTGATERLQCQLGITRGITSAQSCRRDVCLVGTGRDRCAVLVTLDLTYVLRVAAQYKRHGCKHCFPWMHTRALSINRGCGKHTLYCSS